MTSTLSSQLLHYFFGLLVGALFRGAWLWFVWNHIAVESLSFAHSMPFWAGVLLALPRAATAADRASGMRDRQKVTRKLRRKALLLEVAEQAWKGGGRG